MDILEELYPDPEFYTLLHFCDLQPLRDEDWLDVGDMKWNYSNQYYGYTTTDISFYDTYKQFKYGIKTRSLHANEMGACEFGKRIGGIFYYVYNLFTIQTYKVANHKLIYYIICPALLIYDLDRTTTIPGLDLSETKYAGFEDFKVVVIDKIKYCGRFLYDIMIYKDRIHFSNNWYDWDMPDYEAKIRQLFNVKKLEKGAKYFQLEDEKIHTVDNFTPFTPAVTVSPPIYPRLSVEKLIKDPFNPAYRHLYTI